MNIQNRLFGLCLNQESNFFDLQSFINKLLFNRILHLKNCPNIISNPQQKVNIEKLLEVRQSEELIIFREWLKKQEDVSDSEILDQLNNIRSKLGINLQSNTGKTARLAISTFVGVLSPPVGIGLSVLDTFLLEKILPSSSLIAFVDKLYPSLFEKKKCPKN